MSGSAPRAAHGQNAPLASGTRFRTRILLAGPEETEREEALQLKRIELPGGNRERKPGGGGGRKSWQKTVVGEKAG